MHPRVRFWLLDVPLAIWRAMLWWHRVYFTFLIVVSSTVLPLMVLITLVLWFGFGIRWGW